MRRPHFILGWGLTFAILVVMAIVVFIFYPLDRELLPNEFGDTFAGFMAAIAMLWLVISVFQQGEELAATREEIILQRKALDLQAEELRQQSDSLKQQASELKNAAEQAKEQSTALTRTVQQAEIDNFVQILPMRRDVLDNLVVRIALTCPPGKVTRERAAQSKVTLEEYAYDYLINNLRTEDVGSVIAGIDSDKKQRAIDYIQSYILEYDELKVDMEQYSDSDWLIRTFERSRYGIICQRFRIGASRVLIQPFQPTS